jgi:hypothetical protein
MRKVILVLFLISLPNTLWAADTIIGTWKRNLEKSTLYQSRRDLIKDIIEVYIETEGNMIETTYTSFRKEGSTLVIKRIFPKEGGIVKYVDSEIQEGILNIVIPVGSGDWFISTIVNGRNVLMRHMMVSKDGKTLTETIKDINREGKPVERIMVSDRQ